MTTLNDIAAILASPEAEKLPPDLLLKASEVFSEQKIELAERRASEKQRRFQKVFFDRADDTGRRVDILVALGGNRSGKSFVTGWLCFGKYLRDVAKNGDWFWCIGQNLERSVGGQQRELWEALPRWMFGSQTWDSKIGFGMHRKIALRTSDGGTCLVEFRSADQDPSTFEQAKLRGVWCDERLPEGVFNRLLARIVDKSGFILYSDIPEQMWQLDRLIEAEPRAGVFFQSYSMHDNAHNLPSDAIDRAAAQMTKDEQRLRIHGEFVVMEGVIYREYQDTMHVCKPFVIPDYWPKYRAIDYGATAPTACLWLALAPNESFFAYREHYIRNKSIAENAKLILEASRNEQYTRNLIDPCAYNQQPGMSETIATQYGNAGIKPLSGWPRVNEMGEHAMVQKVKFLLEGMDSVGPKFNVFNTCINLRREFRSWRYKTDKDGKPLASDAFDDTGPCHLLDCLKGIVAINPTFTRQRVAYYASQCFRRGTSEWP
jgi:hypothetical protein